MAENFKDTLKNKISDDKLIRSGVKFEKLSLHNEEEYLDFLMEAYKNNFNYYRFEDPNLVRKLWYWEYMDIPGSFKGSPFIWVCRLQNRIIAQVCIMPVELKIGDKPYRGGWCQDVMVLPQFRNMGLGYFIFQYLSEGLDSFFDILLVSGTNKNSYTLLKSIGFLDVGFFSRNIKVLNIKNITEKLTRKTAPRLLLGIFIKFITLTLKLPYLFNASNCNNDDIKVSAADDFSEEFDNFWFKVSRQSPCIIKRDAESLKWRFKDNPVWDYKILVAKNKDILAGYIALKESRPNKKGFEELKIGVISDVLFNLKDDNIGVALFDAAIDYFKEKVDLVRCDILCKEMMPIIKKMGFMGIKSYNRFIVYPLREELKRKGKCLINDRKNWYLTFFDSDLDLS